jgi:hypothetical protein
MKISFRLKPACLLCLALTFLVASCAPTHTTLPVETYLRKPRPDLRDIVNVLAGKSDAKKRETVERILRAKKIDYRVQRYLNPSGRENGANLLFELGSGRKELVLSAHYDAVPGSPGANDDASCVATIISVYERLREQTLSHLKVRFVFFDDEESGLTGSNTFVATQPLKNVVGMISLELCGIGDTVAVWDLKEKDKKSPAISALLRTLKDTNVNHTVVGKIPRYGSDHWKFTELGIPAVAITAVPRRDEAILREYIFQPNLTKWLDRANRPYIFQLYHTRNDAAASIEEPALQLLANTMAQVIVDLNRGLE